MVANDPLNVIDAACSSQRCVTVAVVPPQLVGASVPSKVVIGKAVEACPGQICDAHRGGAISRNLIGIEGGPVIAREAILELVNDVRREDMGLFDDADGGLRRIGLAVVVWHWTDVAARSGLADGSGAGLTPDGCRQCERVLLS